MTKFFHANPLNSDKISPNYPLKNDKNHHQKSCYRIIGIGAVACGEISLNFRNQNHKLDNSDKTSAQNRCF